MNTYVNILIDKSGSMNCSASSLLNSQGQSSPERRIDRAIKDFNSQLKAMRDNVKRDPNLKIFVSLWVFDHNVKSIYTHVPLERVQELSKEQIVPAGNTALLNALQESIENTIPMIKLPTDAALFVVLTDGLENSSSQENRKYVPRRIKELEETEAWTFSYLGAEVSMEDFSSLGSHAGNTMTGLENLGSGATATIHNNYFKGRSAGETRSLNVYGKE